MEWIKKHKFLTVVLAIIGIAVISSAAGGSGTDNSTGSGNNNNSTQEEAQSASEPAAEAAKIGATVRDGKFEFVVKSLDCSKTELVNPDSDAIRKNAQGKFCLVALSVKNVGDEQQFFTETEQKLLNADNVEYSVDSSGSLYLGESSSFAFSQINPGNTVEGTLVYDIPADQTPASIELHDSAFSNGVKVSLQ